MHFGITKKLSSRENRMKVSCRNMMRQLVRYWWRLPVCASDPSRGSLEKRKPDFYQLSAGFVLCTSAPSTKAEPDSAPVQRPNLESDCD